MSDAAIHSEIGERFRHGLRAIRPQHTAKLVAQDLDVCEVTVTNWLKGRLPSTTHLLRAMRVYGANFSAALLAPLGDWTAPLRMRVEIDVLEQHLNQLDERAAAARQDLAALKQEMGS